MSNYNLFNINYYDYIDLLVETFTEIFGEEYRNIINDRLHRTVFVNNISHGSFDHFKDFEKYTSDLKYHYALKYQKEFINQFFSSGANPFGVPINKFNIEIIYFPGGMFDELGCSFDASPLVSFFKDKGDDIKDEDKVKQIEFINQILGNKDITLDNYDEFIKTKEYKELIDYLRPQYDSYLNLYERYSNDISRYIDYFKYISYEKEKNKLVKKEFFVHPLEAIIKHCTKKCNELKDLDKVLDAFFYHNDINGYPDNIFIYPDNVYDKREWIDKISLYLSGFGIDIYKEYSLYNYYSSNDLSNIAKEIYKKYQEYFIDFFLVCLKYEEYKFAAFLSNSRDEYLSPTPALNPDVLYDGSFDLSLIYEEIRNSSSGNFISSVGIKGIDNNEYFPIFLTPYFGCVMLFFLHECCHRIFISSHCCGFDCVDAVNPYDEYTRKYEVFNEALNDVFTSQAMQILMSKGIYLFEPEEFVDKDYYTTNNMPLLVKNAVRKLLEAHSDIIIPNKLESNINGLIECFGEDLFEEFIDALNYLYGISQSDISLSNCINDLLRIDSIIDKMDNARKNHKVITNK